MRASRRARSTALVLLCALPLAAVGCGGASDDAAPVTVTVVESAATEAEPLAAPSTGEDDGAAAPDDASAEQPAPEAEAASAAAGCDGIVVPDVTGGDHQLAQDTMQAAGLYNLSEEDATGQGRLLLYDRNWTVVRQQPAAGSCADEDTTIILSSKKDGE